MRVASRLRERLSLDNWRTINRLTQGLTRRWARQGFSDLLGELDVAIAASATHRRRALRDALNALLAIDPAADLQPGSERLMALFDEWQAATSRHSEELSLRFFSHVGEANTQTFAT